VKLSVNYQQEFLYQVEDDIKYLIELHWDEIALNKDNIKLNPDWDAYSNLEQQGKLKVNLKCLQLEKMAYL
jgi:hypothetical protein